MSNDIMLGELMNPQAGGPPTQPQPPADENELNSRVSGWESFLSLLAEDKNLRDGLITAGTSMLQPRSGGQTQAGVVGQGVAQGLQTYRAGEDRDLKNKLAKNQDARSERTTGAYVKQVDLQEQRQNTENERYADQADARDLQERQLKALVDEAEYANSPRARKLAEDRILAQINASSRQNNTGTYQDRQRNTFMEMKIQQGATPLEAAKSWFDYNDSARKGSKTLSSEILAIREQMNMELFMADTDEEKAEVKAFYAPMFDEVRQRYAATEQRPQNPQDAPAQGLPSAQQVWDQNKAIATTPKLQQQLLEEIHKVYPGWMPAELGAIVAP